MVPRDSSQATATLPPNIQLSRASPNVKPKVRYIIVTNIFRLGILFRYLPFVHLIISESLVAKEDPDSLVYLQCNGISTIDV